MRQCNICGWHGERFNILFNEHLQAEQETICPICNSLARQRVLYKYLVDRFGNGRGIKCLEIAPSDSKPVQKALPKAKYISIDIDTTQRSAMYQADLTHLDSRFNDIDLIVCSHVLEHIKDDAAAIGEMYRVLKQKGAAVIQVPFNLIDTGINTVEHEKPIAYGHLRTYGWDVCYKLCNAGFLLSLFKYADNCICVDSIETLFICTKR